MIAILLALILQVPQDHRQIVLPTETKTVTQQDAKPAQAQAPKISAPQTATAPTLTPDTEESIHMHFQDAISRNGEDLKNLTQKVDTLTDDRESHDRPDINDLQATRTHMYWVVSLLAIPGGCLWWLIGDDLRKFIRGVLSKAESTQNSPTRS